MVKRMPKYKVFGGKRYERAGSSASRTKTKREPGTTSSLDDWADFQRRVNYLDVRVVKSPYGGYEAYVRKGSRRANYERSAAAYASRHHLTA